MIGGLAALFFFDYHRDTEGAEEHGEAQGRFWWGFGVEGLVVVALQLASNPEQSLRLRVGAKTVTTLCHSIAILYHNYAAIVWPASNLSSPLMPPVSPAFSYTPNPPLVPVL